ncbi:MAG: hypothetical protein EP329_19260 [Deltaproteobacteria bacterium]|nr:MAG: hypothetical protein EP329_19260 [Deltaproteobacteria bacterium]
MSRYALLRPALALVAVAALATSACDSAGGDGEATTTCDFNYKNPQENKKGIGETCTVGSECQYGVCILPTTAGNIINNQFGYCSRGCNCDNADGSQLSSEDKASYTCLDPSGFQGAKRQVVPICETVADCTAIDSSWLSCEIPDTGAALKVCHAIQ